MFGYIRPVRSLLRLYEWEDYRAVYCGVCRALAKRYGAWARWTVNYDFTFLAMLLWEGEYGTVKYRCPRHPFCKRKTAVSNAALDAAADATVLFTLWKLRDSIRDGGFRVSNGARLLKKLTGRAFRKAERALPDIAREAERSMENLWALEAEQCESMDKAADPFARMLSSLGQCASDEERRRIVGSMLYHLGRWITITDACHDIQKDRKEGNYNPVAARFGISDGKLTAEHAESLRNTLSFSQKAIGDAYELLPPNPFDGILRNILEEGLTAQADAIGRKTDKKRQRRLNRDSHEKD